MTVVPHYVLALNLNVPSLNAARRDPEQYERLQAIVQSEARKALHHLVTSNRDERNVNWLLPALPGCPDPGPPPLAWPPMMGPPREVEP